MQFIFNAYMYLQKHHTCITRSLKGIIKKNKNPRLNGKKHESQITRIIQTTLDR